MLMQFCQITWVTTNAVISVNFQTFVCLCVSLFLKNSWELCGDIWASLGALTPRPDFPESSATPQATWRAYWATGLRAWIFRTAGEKLLPGGFLNHSVMNQGFNFLLSQVKRSSQLPSQKWVCSISRFICHHYLHMLALRLHRSSMGISMGFYCTSV